MNLLAAPARRLVRATALATVVGLGLVAVGGGPAGAADDVTWTVRTASNELGADRTGYAYALDPGATVQDALVVANRGTEPLDLAVYTADGYTTSEGQFDLLGDDGASVGIGAWVRPSAGTVHVEPGDTAEVPFTVTVPADATPGDHAGGIVTSLAQDDDAQGITVDRRLGIRIGLRVAGELRPALAVEDVQVHYDGTASPVGTGDATVTYTLHNTGNVLLSGRQAVSVSGPFGWLRADAPAGDLSAQLLPGESRTVSVPVHDVTPLVRLGATATLTPLVTDASGSTSTLDPVSGTAHGWAVPWTLVALLVLLAAAVVAGRVALRRRSAARSAREAARVQQAVEEALRAREASSR